MPRGVETGIERGIERGIETEKNNMIQNLLKQGVLSNKQIAMVAEVEVSYVEQLAQENKKQ